MSIVVTIIIGYTIALQKRAQGSAPIVGSNRGEPTFEVAILHTMKR